MSMHYKIIHQAFILNSSIMKRCFTIPRIPLTYAPLKNSLIWEPKWFMYFKQYPPEIPLRQPSSPFFYQMIDDA